MCAKTKQKTRCIPSFNCLMMMINDAFKIMPMEFMIEVVVYLRFP